MKISELHEAVKSGNIDESELEIWIDNDETSFFEGSEDNEIIVADANLMELYKLLFPKAGVSRV